jgi:thiamine-phosphate pyrophosphorylase
VPLVVNDRVDVALAVGADGVHVGQSDMAPEDVRQLVGEGLIVGLSVTGEEELRASLDAPVDYLGVGPVYATATKPDAGSPMGIGGLRLARAMTRLPLVAIGSVNAGNLAEVMAAGMDGAAVVSAVCSAADPEAAARALRRSIDAAFAARSAGQADRQD